mmetsp:Transcript_2210/g.3775  ORF Transcript_2210/g.3775 Transcript_2210/m.3775 type:complete len:234 (-) Transcript_2210:544-1245(-)
MGGGIHSCDNPPGIGCCLAEPGLTGAEDLRGRPLPMAGKGMPPGCPAASLPSLSGLPRPIPLPLELPSKSSSGSHKLVSDAIVSWPSSKPGGRIGPAPSASRMAASVGNSGGKATGTVLGDPSNGYVPCCGTATSSNRSATLGCPARPCKLELERTCGNGVTTCGSFPAALSALAAARPIRRRSLCRALLAALPVSGAAAGSASSSSSDSSASAAPLWASVLFPGLSPSWSTS